MTTWTQSMDGSLPVVHLVADHFWTDEIEGDKPDGYGGKIVFQHGPIKEVGTNGTTIETLIDVLVNRLEGFQHGPFANEYNADALVALRVAHTRLTDRTRDRQARNVEGTNQA